MVQLQAGRQAGRQRQRGVRCCHAVSSPGPTMSLNRTLHCFQLHSLAPGACRPYEWTRGWPVGALAKGAAQAHARR
jgi:hypothetical protein